MRQWRDCKTTGERQGALIEAMRLAQGNVTAAAKLLGLNRQYLHTILARSKAATDTHAAPDIVAKHDRQDTHPQDGGQVAHGVVGRTSDQSLTYVGLAPTLATKMSAATIPTLPQEEKVVRVAFDLSKRHLNWLEQEALRRKQSGELQRQAKSPILAELIEAAMARNGGDSE